MTDEELAAIDAEHQGDYCQGFRRCPACALLAEIHRLRRENQLLKLSQGDLGAVGQD